jgi:hypothetical protein
MVISALSGRLKVVAVFLTLAIAWSSALVVLALLLHQPATTSNVGSYEPIGTPIISGMTLVQQNGSKILIPVGLPLVLTLCVVFLMSSRYRHHRPLVGIGVRICVGLLLALSILGILSVGLFILPVTVFVVLAAAYASP